MHNSVKDPTTIVTGNAAECTVLLKYNGQFPLERAGKLDAFGSGIRYTVKGGTGSGEVNSRRSYTIEEGLEKSGFTITSGDWLDAYDEVRKKAKKQFFKDLKAEAKEKHLNAFMYSMGKAMKEPDHKLSLVKRSDAAVFVLSRNSGEGSDREVLPGDVKLTRSEIRDILALNRMYDRFMLVLNVGGVVDLSPVMEVGNILVLSQLGTDCGAVLGDILLGRQNPSGRLTTTWAAFDQYPQEGTFGGWNDNLYKEGIYVGYRYFDTFGKKALFPFGFGLSYTTFRQSVTEVTNEKDEISVQVRVRNTGSRPGKEVVQVYLSTPSVTLDQPYQQLAGYGKTRELAAGEEQELTVSFRLSGLASYDEARERYILEQGDYPVRVGSNSADTVLAAAVTLKETIVIREVKNCLGKPGFEDIKAGKRETEPIPSGVARISLTSADFCKKTTAYDREVVIDERVKSLSDEELAYLAIGNFDPDARGLSIIGNAATHVAGAAGETTSQLEHRGIRPLIMADGPAGVRIALHYYEEGDRQYDAKNNGMMMDSMLEMMGPVTAFIAKKLMGGRKVPKNARIMEHAATMIPIGTAIAQSFNVELAEQFGDLVGAEMEKFGIHLWLAPALNIHRSILCGRNFEYYSEDPLVSGLTAAAVTHGVQRHAACGTTIKHYAANNAETNRYCNNSRVSERAMREIYLRGFEICIERSQPKSVMTSYNLLNGTHTSEHKGLIEDILRAEFGFEGIVMTDWVMEIMTSSQSIYRNALADEVAKAGGELFMPGTKKDYRRVMDALKKGELSRERLEINASRLLRMIDQFYAA